MTPGEFRNGLRQRRVKFKEKSLQDGVKFRCDSGEIFTVYNTGTVLHKGKQTPLAKEMVAPSPEHMAVPARPQSARTSLADLRVLILYGHDTQARDGLELLMHRMELKPLVLQGVPATDDTVTVIEKLEHYLGEHGNVGFACVLLTPDDEGDEAGRSDEMEYLVRQNFVLELVMVLKRLGRHRVAILHKGSVELSSDMSGLLYVPITERVEEVKSKLFQELKQAGYSPKPEAL